MKRLTLVTALVVAAAVVAGSASPKSAPRAPVVASTSIGLSAGLFLVDPVTLKAVGRHRLSLPFDWSDYSRSPDGSRVALVPPLGTVAFARLETMRLSGTISFGRVDVQLLGWISSRTLVVRVGSSVAAIDARTPRVLWRHPLGG